MRRFRSSSWIANSLEDGCIARKPREAEIVSDVVCEESGFVLHPLVQNSLNQGVVPQNVIEALTVVLDAEDIGEEGMVAEVLSYIWVIDGTFDFKVLEIISVTDTRKLENLGGSDRAS